MWLIKGYYIGGLRVATSPTNYFYPEKKDNHVCKEL
jgi:hypothetical protein